MNLAIRVRNGGLLPALSDHPSLASALNTIKCYPPSCNLSINVPTVMLLSHALASYALASLLSHVPSVAAFPTFSLLSGVVLCHLHLQFTVSCAHPTLVPWPCADLPLQGSAWLSFGLLSSPSWAASRDVSPPSLERLCAKEGP